MVTALLGTIRHQLSDQASAYFDTEEEGQGGAIHHLPQVSRQALKGASEVSGLRDDMWRTEKTHEN